MFQVRLLKSRCRAAFLAPCLPILNQLDCATTRRSSAPAPTTPWLANGQKGSAIQVKFIKRRRSKPCGESKRTAKSYRCEGQCGLAHGAWRKALLLIHIKAM